MTKAAAYVDPLEAFDRHNAGQPPPPPKIVDGQTLVDVTIDAPPDSPPATATLAAVRAKVHALPGAAAKVGGYTATNLDLQLTAQRDRAVVIPLVMSLVLLVLMLLLRAVVAPLILVATVILSFVATLGVSGVVFRDLSGFAGADSSFPLFAFVFLVALRGGLQHLPDDPGPGGGIPPRSPGRDADRAPGDRRRDHVGGRGARRDVRGARGPAAAGPRRTGVRRRVRGPAGRARGAHVAGTGVDRRPRPGRLVARPAPARGALTALRGNPHGAAYVWFNGRWVQLG